MQQANSSINPSPSPAPPFDNPFTFQTHDRNIVRRCCSLTIDGEHCQASALRGENYCVQHLDRDPRAFGPRGRIFIPLLENHATIRLMCTKILHAVANGHIQSAEANAMNRTLSIANRALPRLKPIDPPAVVQKPGIYVVDRHGTWIALPQPLRDADGKLMYYDQLEPNWKQKRTREEIEAEDPDFVLAQSYRKVITDILTQRAAREAAAAGRPFPDPSIEPWNSDLYQPGECPYSINWCPGPWRKHHCAYCKGERPMKLDDPRHPGDSIVQMVDACRALLKKVKAKQEANSDSKHEANADAQQATNATAQQGANAEPQQGVNAEPQQEANATASDPGSLDRNAATQPGHIPELSAAGTRTTRHHKKRCHSDAEPREAERSAGRTHKKRCHSDAKLREAEKSHHKKRCHSDAELREAEEPAVAFPGQPSAPSPATSRRRPQNKAPRTGQPRNAEPRSIGSLRSPWITDSPIPACVPCPAPCALRPVT